MFFLLVRFLKFCVKHCFVAENKFCEMAHRSCGVSLDDLPRMKKNKVLSIFSKKANFLHFLSISVFFHRSILLRSDVMLLKRSLFPHKTALNLCQTKKNCTGKKLYENF